MVLFVSEQTCTAHTLPAPPAVAWDSSFAASVHLVLVAVIMAFPPPHGFLQNYAMAHLMQGQFPTLPMGKSLA